jgi:hypothetical protein
VSGVTLMVIIVRRVRPYGKSEDRASELTGEAGVLRRRRCGCTKGSVATASSQTVGVAIAGIAIDFIGACSVTRRYGRS